MTYRKSYGPRTTDIGHPHFYRAACSFASCSSASHAAASAARPSHRAANSRHLRRDRRRIEQRRQSIGNASAAKLSHRDFLAPRPAARAAANCRTGRTTSAARDAARRPQGLAHSCRCRRDARARAVCGSNLLSGTKPKCRTDCGSFAGNWCVVLREQNAAPAQPLRRRPPPPRRTDAPPDWPSRAKTRSAACRRRETRAHPSDSCAPSCESHSGKPTAACSPANRAAAGRTNPETIRASCRSRTTSDRKSVATAAGPVRAAGRSAAAPTAAARTTGPTSRTALASATAARAAPAAHPLSRGESCSVHNTPGAKMTLATGAPSFSPATRLAKSIACAQNTVSPAT